MKSFVKINVIGLFLLIIFVNNNIFAQIKFSYGTQLRTIDFVKIDNKKILKLPEISKITIFYFPFENPYSKLELDYFSSLQNCFNNKEISIYHVCLDDTFSLAAQGLTSVFPKKPELFQTIWESNLQNASNFVLLFDQNRTIKYLGNIGSPRKFSTVLKKLGLIFSLPKTLSLKNVINKLALENIFSNQRLDYAQFAESKKPKLLFLYRSICTPCGEHILLKNLFNILRGNKYVDVQVVIIFKEKDDEKMDMLTNIFNECQMKYNDVYEAKNLTKHTERFFLKANPLLILFSSENKFIKLKAGNNLSKIMLEKLLLWANEK